VEPAVTNIKNTMIAAIGLGFFTFVVLHIGVQSVVREVAAVGVGIPIIVALSLLRLVLQTRSWSIALRQDRMHASTGELMLVRLASQGMGYLTVLGPVASEPMKISLLRKHPGSATAATLVDTGLYWFTSALLGIVGCVSAAVLLAHKPKAVISALVSAVILFTALLLIARSKLVLAPLVNALGVRCPRWLRKAEQIESAIREFARQEPAAIRQMFLLDLVCQLLMAAEVATVFWCLRLPLHVGTILGVEAASRMVKIVAGWMPARIGADESGSAGAFASFGLSAASGVALALARRIRDLLACLIGLTWLVWYGRSGDDSIPAPQLASSASEVGC
jgi:hypothetical protein